MRHLLMPFVGSLLLAANAAGQVPARSEFRVNDYTTNFQGTPSVASVGNGDFVVAWLSSGQDGDGNGVFGRRFAASGAPLGVEFQVNTYTTLWQTPWDIAAHESGSFVVTWTSRNQDGSSYGVFAQRFGSGGQRLGGEFQVNTYTTDTQHAPVVAVGGNRDIVVAWASFGQDGDVFGSFGRRFAGSGEPLGAEFQVNTFTTGQQDSPSVAAGKDGSFVVVWQTFLQPFDGIFGRRYDASGVPVGAEFTVAPGGQLPSVAALPGGFVVVWETYGTSGFDVFGLRFDAAGAPLGFPFQVNTYTTGRQIIPRVAADAAGNFVVAWNSTTQDGSNYGVFGQRFSAAGLPRGPEFRANTYTPGAQMFPKIASDPVGNFVIAWQSPGQDGSDSGAFAQRFGGLIPVAMQVDTSGNGVLEAGETVDVRPSWRNVNGATQTFAAGLSSISGPPGATYTIADGTGDYGTVPDAVIAACTDCYGVSVSNPTVRPATHWDATAVESITPDTQGQQKIWPLHIGRSFADVPDGSPFYRFVETLLHDAVTGGCSGDRYCPADPTTREQMAVFVLVAKEGPGYQPPACGTAVFGDVPPSSPFCRWIEELARRGVVSGCGGGNYCPAQAVTREQMAVFVLRTLDPTLSPPACTTPVFGDVPADSPFCRWIEELARRGVVTGCGGGNYCPAQAVTREQMGVFIAVTFGLTLYGP